MLFGQRREQEEGVGSPFSLHHHHRHVVRRLLGAEVAAAVVEQGVHDLHGAGGGPSPSAPRGRARSRRRCRCGPGPRTGRRSRGRARRPGGAGRRGPRRGAPGRGRGGGRGARSRHPAELRDQRIGVAGVGEQGVAGRRIEPDQGEAGEAVVRCSTPRSTRSSRRSTPAGDSAGLDEAQQARLDHGLGHRAGVAVAGHVAGGDPEPAGLVAQEVVEVPAGLAGEHRAGGDLRNPPAAASPGAAAPPACGPADPPRAGCAAPRPGGA